MNSSDYWLQQPICPACRKFDHAHCDPDRADCPTQLCECRDEVRIPDPRSDDA